MGFGRCGCGCWSKRFGTSTKDHRRRFVSFSHWTQMFSLCVRLFAFVMKHHVREDLVCESIDLARWGSSRFVFLTIKVSSSFRGKVFSFELKSRQMFLISLLIVNKGRVPLPLRDLSSSLLVSCGFLCALKLIQTNSRWFISIVLVVWETLFIKNKTFLLEALEMVLVRAKGWRTGVFERFTRWRILARRSYAFSMKHLFSCLDRGNQCLELGRVDYMILFQVSVWKWWQDHHREDHHQKMIFRFVLVSLLRLTFVAWHCLVAKDTRYVPLPVRLWCCQSKVGLASRRLRQRRIRRSTRLG